MREEQGLSFEFDVAKSDDVTSLDFIKKGTWDTSQRFFPPQIYLNLMENGNTYIGQKIFDILIDVVLNIWTRACGDRHLFLDYIHRMKLILSTENSIVFLNGYKMTLFRVSRKHA